MVVARSITADRNSAATDGVCEQNTLTRHIFSCLHACLTVSHVTLAHGCSARHTIQVSCACVSDFSSTLHFALFTISLIFYFIPPHLPLHLLCGSVLREFSSVLPRMRSLTLWSTTPLSHLLRHLVFKFTKKTGRALRDASVLVVCSLTGSSEIVVEIVKILTEVRHLGKFHK